MADVNLASMYRDMSPADKEALKALKAEEEKQTGKIVSLTDIISAVTPGRPDPAYLAA